jgi:hypothetical protein
MSYGLLLSLLHFVWDIYLVDVKITIRSKMKEPLGMPKGTVRAIITILVVFSYLIFVGFSLFATVYMKATFEIPTYLTGILGVVIGYYFGSRGKEDKVEAANSGTTTPSPTKYTPPTPAPVDNSEVNQA